MQDRIVGLYAIADTAILDDSHLLGAVRDALEGGARVIQYRDKGNDAAKRQQQARSLASLCRETGTILLVNDDVELALDAGAHGVHLGRDDMSLVAARARLGAGAIIGVSCYNELARAKNAEQGGADYVAFGSFFASRTKPQAVRADISLLQQARATLRVAIVAIGGITPTNGTALVAAGADALAAIDGVFGRADVRAAAAAYARLFRQ